MSTSHTPASGFEDGAPRSLPPVRVIRSPRRKESVSARVSDGVLVVRIPDFFTKHEELMAWALAPALVILLIELALRNTVFRRVP